MNLLLTGFEAFGGRTRNPSQEVALALDGLSVGALKVVSRVLPVDTEAAAEVLSAAIAALQPVAVVCLGEAANRMSISLERVAVNLMDFRIPDNQGRLIVDQAIVADGPAAYFTTLPVRALHDALAAEGVPVKLSLTAGAFLCNQVMYQLLHMLQESEIPAGFVHLPRSFSNPDAELDVDLPAIQAGVRRLLELLPAHLARPEAAL
jgi:pyroglutamyl-peptidase